MNSEQMEKRETSDATGEIQILDAECLKKKKVSKLDPYAEKLVAMEQKNISLPEMREFLKGQGCEVSEPRISMFLKKIRIRKQYEEFLKLQKHVEGRIEFASKSSKRAEAAFKKHPAPDLEILINMHQVLIWEITKRNILRPDIMAMANRMTDTVVQYFEDKAKKAIKEREVKLAETKVVESQKTKEAKAMAFCVKEARAFPEVHSQFRAAFAALRRAKAMRREVLNPGAGSSKSSPTPDSQNELPAPIKVVSE